MANQQLPPVKTIEALDKDKLTAIVTKNWHWILIIIVASNMAAYLTLRWTKDTFKADSEIKLDIKSNVTELGLKTFVQEENFTKLSGEIEQIRSPFFLNQVIDSLDLWVSYYSVGQILVDEMFMRSPFMVQYDEQKTMRGVPIYFQFKEDGFEIGVTKNGSPISGKFGVPINVNGITLNISEKKTGVKNQENNYYFIINSRESLVNYILQGLSVVPINFNANTIRISFTDNNAFKTSIIVNTIDSLYLYYGNQQKNQASAQKIQWLNRELLGIEEKMGGYESYFKNFTIENRSSNVTNDLQQVIVKINKLDSQRYDIAKRIGDLNSLIDDLPRNNFKYSISSLAHVPDYVARKLETLQQKKLSEEKLALAYNENTFAYRQMESELKNLKDQLFDDLLKLKSVWLKRSAELDAQKVKLEASFASMPDKSTQFAKNERFYKLYEELYISLIKSKAEFELAMAGSTPDFKILSSASVPLIPIAPKRSMMLAVGFVVGFVLSFFLIGLLYLLNDKITSVKEIENTLSIPVLGMLPANTLASKTPFFIIEHPKSRLSEAIRNLRSNLDFLNATVPKKILAISSTISGEGKSFLAQNLGGVLALSKKKVILVDLDLRKGKKELPFTLPDANKGVSTILIKKDTWQNCVVPTHFDGLDYLPNGPIPPNPAELLLNGEFDALLSELREVYDYVVLDTPPAGLVSDGVVALKKADLSIYVFRSNYSRKENLRTLNRIIQINKITNIAVAFNDFIPPADNGYGYYVEANKSKRFLNFFSKN